MLDPFMQQGRPDASRASADEVDLFNLIVAADDAISDAELDLPTFAYLECVHRLTMGVVAAWVDSVSVDRAFSVLMPSVVGGQRLRACQQGLAERRTFEVDPRIQSKRGSRALVRLTSEGVLEHYAARADMLPRLAR